jgi:uncharacterized membrane protein YphA (DoxX/SURF4 family)
VAISPPPQQDLLAEPVGGDGRGSGWLDVPLFVVRVVTGLALAAAGAYGVLAQTEARVEAAGIGFAPSDGVFTAVAVALIVVGLLLVLGFLTRIVALLALVAALVAVLLFGREEGGAALVATSALSVALALLVWRGGGMLEIVNAVDPDPR